MLHIAFLFKIACFTTGLVGADLGFNSIFILSLALVFFTFRIAFIAAGVLLLHKINDVGVLVAIPHIIFDIFEDRLHGWDLFAILSLVPLDLLEGIELLRKPVKHYNV